MNDVAAPFITSSDSHTDHIIIGQQLNLNCSVIMDFGISFTLLWIVPDPQKVKVSCLLNSFVCWNNNRTLVVHY